MVKRYLLLLLCLPTLSFADAPQIIKAVEAKYAGVEAIVASFEQTTRSELYGDETQRGELTVKRPRMMRWTFSGDGKQFITDGKTMWIYTPADNQVIKYTDVGSGSGADALLNSLDKLGELFEVTVVSDTPEQKVLSLVARKADPSMKKLELTLSGELVVQKVVITDAFDAVTELAFQKVELAPKVDDAIFQFSVPAGAEVITAGM